MPAKTLKKKAEVTPLTGEALLNRVQELGNLSKQNKAKECGYYTVNDDGSERLNMMKFLNALIEAEGIDLDSQVRSGNGKSRGGRSANYRISVQANGNVLLGSAYTAKMNLKPGDEFEISLGRRQIRLKQVSTNDEAEEA